MFGLEVGEGVPTFLFMVEKIREIIEPIIIAQGAEIVEIIYRPEAGKYVLRVLVDKEGGITISDCAAINELISQALDEANIITELYLLEVDSPGIDRPFKARRDYERSQGRMVRVTLNEAILDKKEYIGRLDEVLEKSIKIDVKKKGIIEILFEKIVRARQEVEFDNDK